MSRVIHTPFSLVLAVSVWLHGRLRYLGIGRADFLLMQPSIVCFSSSGCALLSIAAQHHGGVKLR